MFIICYYVNNNNDALTLGIRYRYFKSHPTEPHPFMGNLE